MKEVVLGRTGLHVCPAGLGSGGHSKLGIAQGRGDDNAVRVIHAALDMGVNFIDTAIAYDTEAVVGRALEGRRDSVVLCSKAPVHAKAGKPAFDGPLATAAEYRDWVEASLARLGTDVIDIYMLHGVAADSYVHVRDRLVPVLERLRDDGKIRFIGLSERFIVDTSHDMLDHASRDDCWDAVMVGFNIVNQSAGREILPRFSASGAALLGSFAVRKALASPASARALVDRLIATGEIDAAKVDRDDPLGFLLTDGGALSYADAAYRFCRHEPGMNMVLTGTGSVDHLRENVESICAPPLDAAAVARAREIFSGVRSASGD